MMGPSPQPARIVAAVVQMTSTADVERNLATAERLIAEAATRGARFVALPENFAFLRSAGDPAPEAQPVDGPWVRRMAAVARAHGITLLLGSIPEKSGEAGKLHNTSVLLAPDGAVRAVYRKIHLFDIDLPGLEHLKESREVAAGHDVVVADTPFGALGMTICYDVRFPELYRALTRRGARVLAVPAAFTDRTGKDHWEVLLRARAIENLAYVVAPNQIGRSPSGLQDFGHSLIVDPWGTPVARASNQPMAIVAEIDRDYQARVRRELPSLTHRAFDA